MSKPQTSGPGSSDDEDREYEATGRSGTCWESSDEDPCLDESGIEGEREVTGIHRRDQLPQATQERAWEKDVVKYLSHFEYTPQPPRKRTRVVVLADVGETDSVLDTLVDPDAPDPLHAEPLPRVDVVILAGGLTRTATMTEYQRTIEKLALVDAELKLVVPGMHDRHVDPVAYHRWLGSGGDKVHSSRSHSQDQSSSDDPTPSEVLTLFKQARQHGIELLKEGTYHFVLANGAKLQVYASPFSLYTGGAPMAFQYTRFHDYLMQPETDLVVTHSPPLEVRDASWREADAFHPARWIRTGNMQLLRRLSEVRPQLHCFGLAAESVGAEMIFWPCKFGPPIIGGALCDICEVPESNAKNERMTIYDDPSATMMTEDESPSFRQSQRPGGRPQKPWTNFHYTLVPEEGVDMRNQTKTLAINAAVQPADVPKGQPARLRWIVDMELELAGSTHVEKAVRTARELDRPERFVF